MYPMVYICLSKGVCLGPSEGKNVICYSFPNIQTYISECYFQKWLYAYCQMYLWLIMMKYLVITNVRGTCSFFEILKVNIVRERLGTPGLWKLRFLNFWQVMEATNSQSFRPFIGRCRTQHKRLYFCITSSGYGPRHTSVR